MELFASFYQQLRIKSFFVRGLKRLSLDGTAGRARLRFKLPDPNTHRGGLGIFLDSDSLYSPPVMPAHGRLPILESHYLQRANENFLFAGIWSVPEYFKCWIFIDVHFRNMGSNVEFAPHSDSMVPGSEVDLFAHMIMHESSRITQFIKGSESKDYKNPDAQEPRRIGSAAIYRYDTHSDVCEIYPRDPVPFKELTRIH